jgi:hypothetical protein
MRISRGEITPDRWMNTTGFPPDGREHFRELSQYGNRHAVLERGADWGIIHHDQYNPTDFPVGTLNHLAKYANEKTGVPEMMARVGIAALTVYAAYRLFR